MVSSAAGGTARNGSGIQAGVEQLVLHDVNPLQNRVIEPNKHP